MNTYCKNIFSYNRRYGKCKIIIEYKSKKFIYVLNNKQFIQVFLNICIFQ